MVITEVRIKLMEDNNENERLQAFCSVTFDDAFVVRDLKIIEETKGSFVAMPSRKLTDRCPHCGGKNHLRARCCNDCGGKLGENRAGCDADGRTKLHADIAHPINSAAREFIQGRIIKAYQEEIERAQSYKLRDYPEGTDPQVVELVRHLICGFADKWTMIILDVLWEEGTLRFSELSRQVPEISQKMLTQTLRTLENDGLVERTTYAEVPPRVEYRLTELGEGVFAPLDELCRWTESNLETLKEIWAAHSGATAAHRQ